MRYGLISDVHANLAALEVAVNVLARESVTALLCAGDIVGYGPQPNECIGLLGEARATCVAGNHDLLALGQLDDRRSGTLAKTTQAWTRAQLGSAERDYLAGLPLVAHVAGLVMAHGSTDNPEKYVWPGASANAELRVAGRRWPSSHFLVLGHTHRQAVIGQTTGTHRLRGDTTILLPPTERTLINPGSVGQSREREARPRVRFALLDTDGWCVTTFSRDYDVAATRSLLTARGLPESSLHLRPTNRGVALRAVRRSAVAVAGRGRA